MAREMPPSRLCTRYMVVIGGRSLGHCTEGMIGTEEEKQCHAPLSLALRGVIEAALAGRSFREYSAGLGQVDWGVWSGRLVAMENKGEVASVGSCHTW